VCADLFAGNARLVLGTSLQAKPVCAVLGVNTEIGRLTTQLHTTTTTTTTTTSSSLLPTIITTSRRAAAKLQ